MLGSPSRVGRVEHDFYIGIPVVLSCKPSKGRYVITSTFTMIDARCVLQVLHYMSPTGVVAQSLTEATLPGGFEQSSQKMISVLPGVENFLQGCSDHLPIGGWSRGSMAGVCRVDSFSDKQRVLPSCRTGARLFACLWAFLQQR